MKGTVARIQRFSTTNGPGLRSTVFLKGCPLRCLWCHNPEMQKKEPELMYYETVCLHCGTCASVCPVSAHRVGPDLHQVDRALCTKCGKCADICPSRALEICGYEAEAAEVVKKLLRDRIFYEKGGGGITISGGEPLFQAAFSQEILMRCKEAGLHTAVDTSGIGNDISMLLPWTDLFLWDVKETDEVRHLKAVGAPLSAMLENLKKAAAAGTAIRLRCPVIPGINNRAEHFERIANLAHEVKAEAVDLVAYHRLGIPKAEAVGETQAAFDAVTEEEKTLFAGILKKELTQPVQWI